jgi:quinol monooxygenase YgiN
MDKVKVGLVATIKAKRGQEAEVAKFLAGALPLANQEEKTVVWFAVRFDESTFAIFDAFADESGRAAHLSGPIAKALAEHADRLLAEPPKIERVDVLVAKLA